MRARIPRMCGHTRRENYDASHSVGDGGRGESEAKGVRGEGEQRLSDVDADDALQLFGPPRSPPPPPVEITSWSEENVNNETGPRLHESKRFFQRSQKIGTLFLSLFSFDEREGTICSRASGKR